MPWPLPGEPEISHLLLSEFNKEDLGNNDVALLQVLETRANHHPGDFGRLDLTNVFNLRLRETFGIWLNSPLGWSESLRGMDFTYAGPPAEDKPEEYGAIRQLGGPEEFQTLLGPNYTKIEQGNRVMDNQEKIYVFLERLCSNFAYKTVVALSPIPHHTK